MKGMCSITYGVVEETYTIGDSARISYGIVAYSDAEHDGTVTIVASVRAVCSDKERISAFVETCNRLELSLTHLNDVVDDFLSDRL